MIPIRKGPVPPLLARYAAIPGACYDGGVAPDGLTFTQVKDEIRQYLAREQGHICAYCMGRIRPTEAGMKVEHWASQKDHPVLQLAYSNMLGCCCGRSYKDGKPEDHCDSFRSRENRPLAFNPSDPSHHARLRIRCKPNGEIGSGDPAFDGELRTVLNLNATRLVANRKQIWKRVTDVLSKIHGTASRAEVEGLKTRWAARSDTGQLQEYCGVAIQYIETRLARLP